MSFKENLDIFTLGEFSSQATLEGVLLPGIFDEYYDQMFDLESSIPTEGQKYCFKVQTSLIPNVNHGNNLQLIDKKREFEVIGIQPCSPDGVLTNLILKEL